MKQAGSYMTQRAVVIAAMMSARRGISIVGYVSGRLNDLMLIVGPSHDYAGLLCRIVGSTLSPMH